MAQAIADRYEQDVARAQSERAAVEAARRAAELAADRAEAELRARVVTGEAPGTKVCPRCAEEVKLAALVCRFCGYSFEDNDAQPAAGRSAGPGAARPAANTVAVGDTRSSGPAIAAFICSVIGLWMAALPLGIYAQKEIDRSGGRLTGRGFATAAIVIGMLGIVGTIVLISLLATGPQNPGP